MPSIRTSTLCPPCCPNTINGNDHGTWGGYFDWQDDIVDTSTNWSCALFLVGTNSGYAVVDACPETNLVADVGVQRPQQFRPPPGRMILWTVTGTNGGSVLQSGMGVVDADGRVRAEGIGIPRDPRRIRLNIGLTPARTRRFVDVRAIAASIHRNRPGA